MRLMYWGKDGGPESTVWGFWPIELKKAFSIALLRFENGSREAYHDHAFNAISWVLKGYLVEYMRGEVHPRTYGPSFKPIITKRADFHKVWSNGITWAITLRGPWVDKWHEVRMREGARFVTLTHGRKEVS